MSQIKQVLEPNGAHQSSYYKSSSGTSGLLETLQHFESVAFGTMGSPSIQKAMRKNCLLLSQEAPFLFHTVLAYSAHHLKYLQPDRQERHDSAIYHKQRALQLYREELSGEIGRLNADAVFTACMILALLAYTADDVTPGKSWVFSDEPEAISWLSVQAGFLTLKSMGTLRPHLANGIWSSLIQESDEQCYFYDLRTGTEGLPSAFVELCGIDELSTDESNAYHAALRVLMSMMHIDSGIQSSTKLISFPGRMRPEFFLLVRERDPAALLIMSYWLGQMCRIEQWWCVPRAKSECLAICTYLDGWPDARLQALLDVPMRACGYIRTDRMMSGTADPMNVVSLELLAGCSS